MHKTHNSWKEHHKGQARTLILLEIVTGLIPCGQLSLNLLASQILNVILKIT